MPSPRQPRARSAPVVRDALSVDSSAPTLGAERRDGPELAARWSMIDELSTVEFASVDLAVEGPRYVPRAALGQGGMGTVELCFDAQMGREVALKAMREDLEPSPEVRARFLREARIQGQLEHPAIVPVHEIGQRGDGTSYFTMKRVRGLTLEAVLAALREGDAEISARFSLRKLLGAFVSVCMAVDFAHHRGVGHRDLKPSNVMLGSFGEVYVLDWGLAKLGVEPAPVASAAEPLATMPAGGQTSAGALLGTPAYMAPEHLMDGVCDRRTDVFALGAILFEILALEPLSPETTMKELIATAGRGVEARTSVRCPERGVPPELENICVRATARSPEQRPQSARELSDAVERYLEGDRDLERRRELARAHADGALAALRAASAGAASYESSRSLALRELGRALSLDPDNHEAAAALMHVLTDPPKEIPPEVRAALDGSAQQALRSGGRMGAFILLGWFVFFPIGWWMGLRDVPALALVFTPITLAAVVALLEMGRPVIRDGAVAAVLALMAVGFVAISRVFGPFILVPTLVATFAAAFQAHPRAASRNLALALGSATILVSIALEYSGVVPRTFALEGDRILIRVLGELREGPTVFFFATTAIVLVLAPSYFLGRMRRELNRAEERVALHAWHVERMMPVDVPPKLPTTAPVRTR